MKISKEFFAEFGKVVCSMTLGGGKLSPDEKEVVIEMADGIFRGSSRQKSGPKKAPWAFMFAYPSDFVCEPDLNTAFERWMHSCDTHGWTWTRVEAGLMNKLILLIARSYGLSSPEDMVLLETFKEILYERAVP